MFASLVYSEQNRPAKLLSSMEQELRQLFGWQSPWARAFGILLLISSGTGYLNQVYPLA
jgi:hypothetical protein